MNNKLLPWYKHATYDKSPKQTNKSKQSQFTSGVPESAPNPILFHISETSVEFLWSRPRGTVLCCSLLSLEKFFATLSFDHCPLLFGLLMDHRYLVLHLLNIFGFLFLQFLLRLQIIKTSLYVTESFFFKSKIENCFDYKYVEKYKAVKFYLNLFQFRFDISFLAVFPWFDTRYLLLSSVQSLHRISTKRNWNYSNSSNFTTERFLNDSTTSSVRDMVTENSERFNILMKN